MLAGHSRGVSDFAELMRALAAAGYQAVAIKIHGAEGSSGPFDQLTVDMMVEDIEAVAWAVGLGRFHILGPALGSRLARYFATCHPDTIRTVIVLAGSGRPVVSIDHTLIGGGYYTGTGGHDLSERNGPADIRVRAGRSRQQFAPVPHGVVAEHVSPREGMEPKDV